jgi:hypothetical protein
LGFGSFLALNGQPATIEHRNNPNLDDREKYRKTEKKKEKRKSKNGKWQSGSNIGGNKKSGKVLAILG